MIMNEIFICGDRVFSHPVSNLFHLTQDTARGEPTTASIGKFRLLLADCRLAAPGRIPAWTKVGLEAGKPVLLLCPSQADTKSLEGVVGVLPTHPTAAVLIEARRNESGLVNFNVKYLEYSLASDTPISANGPSALAKHQKAPHSHGVEAECACIDFAQIGGAFVLPHCADLFKVWAEQAMDSRTRAAAQDQPPTGLKYFLNTITALGPFTYSAGGKSNGAGSLAITWTVWGFLNQTATANSQYLVAASRISLSPGSLASDDECDRGFGNAWLSATLAAPMSPQASVPTSGDGTFSGTVDIPISYKSPTGGYAVWTFTDAIANTVSSWACKSISNGATLGSMWWMTSPCNGSNLSDSWSDAFSTWGHVGGFSGASNGALDVNAIAAWVAPTLLSGYQTVAGNFGWCGTRFWGSSCSPGMYWGTNAQWQPWSWPRGFSVDFTPIQPS